MGRCPTAGAGRELETIVKSPRIAEAFVLALALITLLWSDLLFAKPSSGAADPCRDCRPCCQELKPKKKPVPKKAKRPAELKTTPPAHVCQIPPPVEHVLVRLDTVHAVCDPVWLGGFASWRDVDNAETLGGGEVGWRHGAGGARASLAIADGFTRGTLDGLYFTRSGLYLGGGVVVDHWCGEDTWTTRTVEVPCKRPHLETGGAPCKPTKTTVTELVHGECRREIGPSLLAGYDSGGKIGWFVEGRLVLHDDAEGSGSLGLRLRP